MARKRYMSACAVTMIVALTSGCIMFGDAKPSVLEPKDTPRAVLNCSDTKTPETYMLPKDWDAYIGNLESLIGLIVFFIPDPSAPSDTSPVPADIAITESAKSKINTDVINKELYASKVEGSFGANLSFVVGRVEIKQDHLYDVTLTESIRVTIPPDSNFFDSQKLSRILSQAPDYFYNALWVTGIKIATMVVKDYWHIERQGDASYSLIKVGGKYYSGDETTSILSTIFIVGTEQRDIFGILNSQTGLYKKRPAVNLSARYEPSIFNMTQLQRKLDEPRLLYEFRNCETCHITPEEDEKVRKAFLKFKPSQLKRP